MRAFRLFALSAHLLLALALAAIVGPAAAAPYPCEPPACVADEEEDGETGDAFFGDELDDELVYEPEDELFEDEEEGDDAAEQRERR